MSAETRGTPAVPIAERLLYRLDEIAGLVGVSRRTIERQRSAGRFPQPDLRIGKTPLWKPATVQKWIDSAGQA